MDRSPFPPRVHSHSTPALIPQLDNPNHTQQQQQHYHHNNNNNHYNHYHSNRYGGHSSNMPHPLTHHASDETMAAHFLAAGPPPTEPFGGQTWFDFLRETGADDAAGPYPSFLGGGGGQMLPPARVGEGGRGSSGGGGLLQPEALGGAERKRRLTAPEPPTRRPGYAGGDGGGGGSGASFLPLSAASGSSPATAIDLTASPAARPCRGGGHAERADAGRRESDIVLPAWQPDSEVAQCPVCGNQFSFWYRKHHCRYVLEGFFFVVFEGFGMGLRRIGSGFSAFLLLLGRLISQGGCVLRGTLLGVVLRGSALILLSLDFFTSTACNSLFP